MFELAGLLAFCVTWASESEFRTISREEASFPRIIEVLSGKDIRVGSCLVRLVEDVASG